MVNGAWNENFASVLQAAPGAEERYRAVTGKISSGNLPVKMGDFKATLGTLLKSHLGATKGISALLKQLDSGDLTLWHILNPPNTSEEPKEAPAHRYIVCREMFDFSMRPRLSDIFGFHRDLIEETRSNCSEFRLENLKFRKYTSNEYAHRISAPTLLLTGKWDSVTPFSYNSAKLHMAIRNSTAFEIPFAGHGTQMERRECSVGLIRAFLEGGSDVDLRSIFHSEACQKE